MQGNAIDNTAQRPRKIKLLALAFCLGGLLFPFVTPLLSIMLVPLAVATPRGLVVLSRIATSSWLMASIAMGILWMTGAHRRSHALTGMSGSVVLLVGCLLAFPIANLLGRMVFRASGASGTDAAGAMGLVIGMYSMVVLGVMALIGLGFGVVRLAGAKPESTISPRWMAVSIVVLAAVGVLTSVYALELNALLGRFNTALIP